MVVVPKLNKDSENKTVIHNDEYKTNSKSENEVCMKTMTVPNTDSMIYNLNIFIGNSGTSTYSTRFGEGIINVKRGNTNDSVMVGSGNVMIATTVGNLLGIICNRFWEEMNKGFLQEVDHCPSMRCNVFNITKLLLEG